MDEGRSLQISWTVIYLPTWSSLCLDWCWGSYRPCWLSRLLLYHKRPRILAVHGRCDFFFFNRSNDSPLFFLFFSICVIYIVEETWVSYLLWKCMLKKYILLLFITALFMWYVKVLIKQGFKTFLCIHCSCWPAVYCQTVFIVLLWLDCILPSQLKPSVNRQPSVQGLTRALQTFPHEVLNKCYYCSPYPSPLPNIFAACDWLIC